VRSRVNVVVVDAAAMVDPAAERPWFDWYRFTFNLSPPNCHYCRAGACDQNGPDLLIEAQQTICALPSRAQ